MIKEWNVRVRMLDSRKFQVAESNVRCCARDSATACIPALAAAQADIKAAYKQRKQALPKVHAVAFLVAPAKEKKR